MKTDWKDDIFTQRKIRLTENSDGTVTPVDATTYTQKGDSFGAKELNEIGEEINEVKKSVSDGKAEIAAAITLKRVTTAASATFHTMAENIKKIVLGSGNAQKGNVLAGKTFTNDDGVQYTGEMPERAGEQIPASQVAKTGNAIIMKSSRNGHINETTTVAADQSAVASAAGVNGDYMLDSINILGVQGKIQSMAGVTITPQTYAQTVWSAWKRMTGNVEIAAVPLPPASVIKKGYRYWIGGNYVDGTFEGYVPVATDLYLRGNNINSWVASSTSTIRFETGQITIVDAQMEFIYGGKTVNLAGFSRLCIEGWFRHNYGNYGKNIVLYASDAKLSTGDNIGSVSISPQQTITNPVINFSLAATKYLTLRFDSRVSGVIYRIWLE